MGCSPAIAGHFDRNIDLILRDVAQPGSALRSGRRGRWFESSHPDSIFKRTILQKVVLFIFF